MFRLVAPKMLAAIPDLAANGSLHDYISAHHHIHVKTWIIFRLIATKNSAALPVVAAI